MVRIRGRFAARQNRLRIDDNICVYCGDLTTCLVESGTLLRTSPIRCLSDSIVTDGSEMIRCEGRRDFSMSMVD
jgi:hypothetical protein